MAVMLYLKPTSVNDIEKFKRLEPVAMRLDIKQGINNCLLINDTYNSDINSLDIALDFQQSRRVEQEFKMHTNPFRHPAIGNVAEVSL